MAITLIALMVMMAAFTGCGSSDSKTAGTGDSFKIGIVQLVEHTSLDQIREAIIAQLEAEGYKDGENITIDYQNAQNEQSNLKTICQGFVADKVDVIVAITTPAAQVAMGETSDIPIIFSAVTDPVAAGVVKDLDNPGGNITGTSDAVDVAQIQRRHARQQFAVDRHGFSGEHENHIAKLHVLHGDGFEMLAVRPMGRIRSVGVRRFDGLSESVLGNACRVLAA